jgi:hypothetical protein
MDEKFLQRRECMNCGHVDERYLLANQAAFVSRRQWSCSKCGDPRISRGFEEMPEVTESVLGEWAINNDLEFVIQDEDMFLAGAVEVETLLNNLDKANTLHRKKSMLLAALCFVIYENVPKSYWTEEDLASIHLDEELAQRILSFLKNRLHLFQQLDTDLVPDYIKSACYPLLDS